MLIELIFGGGWCILGETALENGLQSNKQEETESKKLSLHAIYKHPLLVSNKKSAFSYIHSNKGLLSPAVLSPELF